MKVLIICFDFKESKIYLQPWRYIYEISKEMASRNIDVEIVSDGYPTFPQQDRIDGVAVHRLRQFRSVPFTINNELIRLIDKKSPDIILWTIGATSFYLTATLKNINKPIIGIWMSTTYSLKQIMNLGLEEMIRNFSSIYLFVIYSLIPAFLIKSVLKQSSFKKIIVLNNNSKNLISNQCALINEISVIPPGITDYDLEFPNIHETEKLKKTVKLNIDSFVVLYLGSPLSLRGVDTVIDAVSIIRKKIPLLNLIILSRRRSDNLIEEENHIINLCKKKKIDDITRIIPGFLSRETIKSFIVLSDVIALPFKIVQSDTPVSILEAMALGKPVISTKIDGIPELLEGGRGVLINPNDPKALADAILNLYLNTQLTKEIGDKAREYMLKYPTWYQVNQEILNLITNIS